jgi:hypothetical protein
MGTLVIVHWALEDGPGWDVFVGGREAALRVPDLAALNVELAGLGLLDPDTPGTWPDYRPYSLSCQGYQCGYAATGTVVWAPPGEWMVRRGCVTHQEDSRGFAARSELPCATLADVITVPQDQFFRTRSADMELLTVALVGQDIPDVFAQPACGKCKARVCPAPAPGRLEWMDAAGSGTCKRRGGHVVTVDGIAEVIGRRYAELAAETAAAS